MRARDGEAPAGHLVSQGHVCFITLADRKWPDFANPSLDRGVELGWGRLRGPPAAHDQIPLTVTRLRVMAHVFVTAHGPKTRDGKFRVVQRYTDRMPGIWIRRVIRKYQGAPLGESTQCCPEAVREVEAELLGRVVSMRKER
jgi:hypothetical protein